MRLLKILVAAAAITALSIGVPAVLASTASAAVTPVIYNYASGWHNAAIRPPWIVIGQGGSPMAHTWWWNTWNSTVAKSTGTLWVDNCIPNCAQGKESYHHLYVTLSGVKYHNGRAYYSVMTWYTPGYRTFGSHGSTLVLHFSTEGGTVPAWH
jgi:hypothetical protein